MSLTQCIIFLLGVLSIYRSKTRELKATGLNVKEFDEEEGLDPVVISLVLFVMGGLAIGAVWDTKMVYYARADRKMRQSKVGCI